MDRLERLISNSVVYIVGQALTRCSSLLTLPIVSGALAVEEFGSLSASASLNAGLRIFLGIASSGAAGIIYFKEQSTEHRSRVMTALHQIAAISATFAFAGAALVWWNQVYVLSLPPSLLSLSLVFLGSSLIIEPYLIGLQFRNEAKTAALAQAVVSIAAAILAITAVRIYPSAASWFFAQILANIIFIVMVARSKRSIWSYFEKTAVAGIARAGGPLIPGAIALFLLQAFGSLAVSKMFSMAEAGRFGLGYQLGAAAGMALAAAQSAWIPFFLEFKHADRERRMEVFGRVRRLYIGMVGAGLIAYVALAELCLVWFFSADYHGAQPVIAPIVMTQFLLGVWSLLLPNLYYAEKTSVVSGLQILSALVSVLMISALGNWGPAGIAVAQMFGAASLVLFQIAYNRAQGFDEDLLGGKAAGCLVALGLLAVLRVVEYGW